MHNAGQSIPPAGILVIGYGNTLRRDDGVGPLAAQAISALNLPGVSTLTRDLLTPELADPISRFRVVFFLDASVEPSREVRIRELKPNPTCQVMAHAADPATMLALARDVFGHAPEGWCVTIPVEDLGIGEQLSDLAARGLKDAVEAVRRAIEHYPPPPSALGLSESR